MNKLVELYEISQALENLEDFSDELLYTQISTELEQRTDGIMRYIIGNNSNITAIDYEIQRLKDRKEYMIKKNNKVEDMVKQYMIESGQKKISTPIGDFSIRKSTGIVIEDESKISEEFWTTKVKTEVVIDKLKLKEYLKDNTVSGAYIEERQNLNIK